MENKTNEKKKNGWMTWLIIAIIVIIIVIFSMRSCNRKKMDKTVVVTEEVMEMNGDKSMKAPTEGVTFVKHTLPDGQEITVAQGGCEDCMMKYILSDKYKNATDKELRDSWIQFDMIDFKHGSATELEPSAMPQIENIAKILKNYPDVKIMIGGMADKTGTKAANMKISKERAEYVKALLAKQGIDAKRISTEGFGKEFANVPSGEDNAKRATDRSIAMRFMK